MVRNPRFAFLFVFLLALVVVFVVQPDSWPRNWLWADTEPILDPDGEAIGQIPVGEPLESPYAAWRPWDPFPDGSGGSGGDVVILRNPIVTRFFPADFHPTADPLTGEYRRYGVVLARGDSTTPGILAAVVANVNPNNPRIVHQGAFGQIPVPENNFFAGKAEAVLAVSALDPSGNGNGSLAFVISGKLTEFPQGAIVVLRNAWGPVSEVDVVPGLTGPVSVAIDDGATGGPEVIVVEQTEDGEGNQECAVGQSPLRFISLATGEEVLSKRLCIDGVGDSADMEIDSDGRRLFIARSFNEGKVSKINLNTFVEETFDVYLPAGSDPAPGLDLDLLAGKGYLAAPQFNGGVGGLLGFNLTTGAPDQLIQADVYYVLQSSVPTGLQEVSVSNFPGGGPSVRRGIVISRSDPVNYPNRADQVTRINLISRNTNRLDTDKQTTAIAFVPQRSTDQSNQEFFLRVKVKSSDQSVAMKLKKYDSGTVP